MYLDKVSTNILTVYIVKCLFFDTIISSLVSRWFNNSGIVSASDDCDNTTSNQKEAYHQKVRGGV
jgi:hypothetical protein